MTSRTHAAAPDTSREPDHAPSCLDHWDTAPTAIGYNSRKPDNVAAYFRSRLTLDAPWLPAAWMRRITLWRKEHL